MPRGRPRKPTALKALMGNPGKRSLDTNEPRPDPTPPRCPQWLAPEAKRKWKALVPELSRLGILTCVDGDALAAYCTAWAEFRTATETLEAEGRFVVVGGYIHNTPVPPVNGVEQPPIVTVVGGQRQPHPAVAMQRAAMKTIKDFSSLYGLNPSDRSKLSVEPPKEKDDLSVFLGESHSSETG